MIKTKADLKSYIARDLELLPRKRPRLFGDECFRYLIVLRKLEYYRNKPSKNIFDKIFYGYYRFRHYRQSVSWSVFIPPNTFGPGLNLFHTGTIVVNDSARIGAGCDLYSGVNIAKDCKIGNNVYIAPGAKILPGVEIADNIRIGANAVVTKSFTDPGITIAGVPAVKISDKGTKRKVDLT